MINLETLFYGTKSLLYGIILGLLGTLAMYKSIFSKNRCRNVYSYKTYYNFCNLCIYLNIYYNEIFNIKNK